ncbi:MAG: hypothetical protein WCB51_11390 [Candidatus Dormiibacterota bacterium]
MSSFVGTVPRSVSVNPVNGQVAVADFQNSDISSWSSSRRPRRTVHGA